MGKEWHGGKGSAQRTALDQKKFEDNWDKIFGKKEKDKKDDRSSGRREKTK
jgi:hypothetical protein